MLASLAVATILKVKTYAASLIFVIVAGFIMSVFVIQT
jgi:hypothetical protein